VSIITLIVKITDIVIYHTITMPKSTRITKCSLCKMTGHNLRTCEKRKSVSARKQHTIKLYRKHARLLKEKRKVLKDSGNQLNELKTRQATIDIRRRKINDIMDKLQIHMEKLKNEMADISSEFIDNQEQIINIKKLRTELNNNYI
jgi:chromosome segregation ATPase